MNQKTMKNIAVLAGGNSGEYEVSLKTAQNICSILDKTLFMPYFIHVKGTEWSYTDEIGRIFSIDKNDFTLPLPTGKVRFDVAFIAIHGNPGEDGKMQGYFDMLQIPYTGCDCFCSALTFNKYFCNVVVSHLGVPVAPSIHFYKNAPIELSQIEALCGYPCFVKPCNSGSSVGVTKAHERSELQTALTEAFRHDNQLMVEQFIKGREMTCGVAKVNRRVQALAVTEVIAKNEFYDYQAKYTDVGHELITPANIPSATETVIKHYSELIYEKLGCKGVVRIDFIVTPEGKPFFLEINTIPGQTALSIIPCQVKYLGIELQTFYRELIEEEA
jgi:D-alanine-D-alanine ligase